MSQKTRQITADKLICRMDTTLEYGEPQQNGDETRLPVKLVVRTDKPVSTWMGALVHELKGAFYKDTIPIDWVHDRNFLIGAIQGNSVKATNENLTCLGEIISTKKDDKAAEIIKQQAAGIPFEASIFFGGEGIKAEEIPEGYSVTVNGKEFTGPGIVVREWPLRGVALCPYGRDQETSVSTALTQEVVPVLITKLLLTEGKKMSEEKKTPEELAQEEEEKKRKALEAEANTETAGDEELDLSDDDDEDEKELVSPDGVSGSQFVEDFGEAGAVCFAHGKTYVETSVLYIKKLEADIKKLQTKLNSLDLGGDEEVEFEDDEEEDAKAAAKGKRVADLSTKIGPGAAAFADSIKLPGKTNKE